MTVLLESDASELHRWKKGPDLASLAKQFGERPVGLSLERVHFPANRPVQLVYMVKLRSGGRRYLFAEYCPGDPERRRSDETASLQKSRRGQRDALARLPLSVDRSLGLVLRRPGLDARLPGLRTLHDTRFAQEMISRLTGRDPGPVHTKLLAHRLGKRGEFFWVDDHLGNRIYESPFYDDPVFLPYDPPLFFDSPIVVS